MRDIGLVAFLVALLALGFKRPFFFVLAYAYVDIVSPHRLSYYLLNAVPVSMICSVLAIGGWLLFDKKTGVRVAPRQWLLLILIGWCAYTTSVAEVVDAAHDKWAWVWKALLFAAFLPFTLRTKLRIEALLLYLVLSAASIIITGGIKTFVSGGGYGQLSLLVDSNAGLYESSTISTVAIAIIPLALFLAQHGTVFRPEWKVRTFVGALIFACLLIPIGTEARTGLLCLFALVMLMLRSTKRRTLYITMVAVAGLITVPLLPSSFSNRMNTIEGFRSDTSASTRIAVWKWTLGYVAEHPLGGGFDVYRNNKLTFEIHAPTVDKNNVATTLQTDQGRAFHSAYFEMLGEQGFPGFLFWVMLHLGGIISMERLRWRYRERSGDDAWVAPLATALEHAQIVYLVGALFVGIAFQPFVLMLLATQIGLAELMRRRERERQADNEGQLPFADTAMATR